MHMATHFTGPRSKLLVVFLATATWCFPVWARYTSRAPQYKASFPRSPHPSLSGSTRRAPTYGWVEGLAPARRLQRSRVAQDSAALRVDDRCTLKRPVRVSAKERGRGRKQLLKKGQEVRVAGSKNNWLLIISGKTVGWLRARLLQKRCQLVAVPVETPRKMAVAGGPSEAPTSANTETPAEPEALPPISPPPPVVEPEGTELCPWGAPAACESQCNAGHSGSCHRLGEHFRQRILEEESAPATLVRRAVAAYTKACNRSQLAACVRLGDLYDTGRGVPLNPAAAASLFTKACEGGNGLGCTHMGFMHREGRGVEPDAAKAASYYSRGCELKSPQGCTGLGALYLWGTGIGSSAAKALELFSRACAHGGPTAAEGCTQLGFLHETAKGTPRDLARARSAYAEACRHGTDYACARAKALSPKKPRSLQPAGTAKDTTEAEPPDAGPR